MSSCNLSLTLVIISFLCSKDILIKEFDLEFGCGLVVEFKHEKPYEFYRNDGDWMLRDIGEWEMCFYGDWGVELRGDGFYDDWKNPFAFRRLFEA